MSVISAIRSLALNIVLFAGLELSHHLGGGSYSFSLFLLPIFLASFFVFWAHPVESIRGPYLAFLLVIVQALGHFELSGNSRVSNLQMLCSHTLGIALSYYLASNFDRGIVALFEVLGSFFKPTALVFLDLVALPEVISGVSRSPFKSREFYGTWFRRGPPL